MSNFYSFLRFHAIRSWERMLSPSALLPVFSLIAGLRAAFKKCPAPLLLPPIISPGAVVPGTKKSIQNFYLNGALTFFPERLASPKWLERCSFSGLEVLLDLQRRRQPAVIVVCHFGPFYLLRQWLQAAGVRAATLVAGQAGQRSYLSRLKDDVRRFPELPAIFYPQQLRQVSAFLADGNALIIAVDKHSGNLMTVPVDDRVNFKMATGAFRLAARHRARLLSCNITDEGGWRFKLELGRPVPEELLSDPSEFTAAGRHLLDELLPGFRARPDQCTPMIVESFQPAEITMSNEAAQ